MSVLPASVLPVAISLWWLPSVSFFAWEKSFLKKIKLTKSFPVRKDFALGPIEETFTRYYHASSVDLRVMSMSPLSRYPELVPRDLMQQSAIPRNPHILCGEGDSVFGRGYSQLILSSADRPALNTWIYLGVLSEIFCLNFRKRSKGINAYVLVKKRKKKRKKERKKKENKEKLFL